MGYKDNNGTTARKSAAGQYGPTRNDRDASIRRTTDGNRSTTAGIRRTTARNNGILSLTVALITILAATLLLPQKAAAQNFDPTVEVTTAYQAGKIEVNKPLLEMSVPDTVMTFALDFDYSIAPNPYKGSYSFHPYVIDVEPETSAERARTFFLRLGAGYSLHPTVDIIYTPRFKTQKFSMSLYGTHRSYFGKYRNIAASAPETGAVEPAALNGSRDDIKWDRSKFSGYNAYTDAGIYGRTDWDTGFFSFDVGYTGYARRDTSFKRSFDMLHAKLRVASRKDEPSYFYYDFSASYLYGSDNTRTVGTLSTVPFADTDGKARLNEQDFSLNAVIGQVFSLYSRLLLDVRFDLSEYRSYLDSYSGVFSVTPKYILRRNRWLLHLGMKISALIGQDHTVWPYDISYFNDASVMHLTRGQYVYPDVEIGFDAIKSHLNIYLKATGGDSPNSYTSLVSRNQFLSLNYAWNSSGKPLMDNTVEKVNARLGFRGGIGSKFTFDLYGGYALYDGLPLDLLVASPDLTSLSPALSYSGRCNYEYATLEMGWHSTHITADGRISYVGTDAVSKGQVAGFAPAKVSGGFNIVYNWRKRIYVGVHGEGAGRRDGMLGVLETYTAESTGASVTDIILGNECRIPGWFDLGLSAEYRFNRTFSVWAYGSNLLNDTIMLAPLYCSSGIALTAGVTITL